MTRFGLIRHGQTDANRAGRFQGATDNPLNATGIQQAHAALDSSPIAVAWHGIYSSDLQRAVRTAQIIAEDHSVPYLGADPRLREINWGAAEDIDTAIAEQRWPQRSFPGRENASDVVARAWRALDEFAERHPEDNILLAVHGTLIRFLLSSLTGSNYASIPNGSYSEILVEPARARATWIAGQEMAEPWFPRPAHGTYTIDEGFLIPLRASS